MLIIIDCEDCYEMKKKHSHTFTMEYMYKNSASLIIMKFTTQHIARGASTCAVLRSLFISHGRAELT